MNKNAFLCCNFNEYSFVKFINIFAEMDKKVLAINNGL